MVASIDTAARLQAAIGTGEILRVRYHACSQPGSTRDLVPLQLTASGLVWCRCQTSGGRKQFRMDKLEILDIDPASFQDEWTYQPRQLSYASLEDVVREHGNDLEAANWTIRLVHDDDGSALQLFAMYKNGKVLRKHPSIVLSFEHTAYDHVAMPDGSFARMDPRPRSRPWSVRGGDKTGTWGSLDKAVAAFLTAARIG